MSSSTEAGAHLPSTSPSSSPKPLPPTPLRRIRPPPVLSNRSSSSSASSSPTYTPKSKRAHHSASASSTPKFLPTLILSSAINASLENLWIHTAVGELHALQNNSIEPQTPALSIATGTGLSGPARRLIWIPANANVAKACAILTAHAILSAPVFDIQAQVYLGLFDWRDVGAAVVKAALEEQAIMAMAPPHSPTVKSRGASPAAFIPPHPSPTNAIRSRGTSPAPFVPPVPSPSSVSKPHVVAPIPASPSSLLQQQAQQQLQLDNRESLLSLQAEKVVDLSKKNQVYSVPKSATMLCTLEFFAKGIHRLLIAEDNPEKCVGEGAFIGVISQSDAVRYLYSVLKSSRDSTLTEMKRTSIRDAGIGSSPIVHIQGTKSVLEALQLMEEEKVTSIAVLGERNEIQGNLSTTDIKYLFRKRMLTALQEPCAAFINKIRQRQGIDNEGKDRSPYFSISWETSVEVAIGKLVATRAHRLFIVEQRKPVGVLSLSDILKYFTPKESLHFWHPHFVPATSG